MPARASEEKGFGLIELLFAMLILNIGILALVAAFQSGALALRRSAATSNGTAVADRVMEVYRDLRNSAIYLTASGTNGIPQSTSTYYTQYMANTAAYAGTDSSGAAATAYYWPTASSAPQWVTDGSGRTYGSNISVNSSYLPSLPSGTPNPTYAVQQVQGPDGQYYTVFSYVVQVKESVTGATTGYVKQVTVEVLDPQNSSRVLASESSLFDPYVSP